jgi:hypothetical protein|tara:strand:- start:50 stop:583 length:534 start_codon:yes stop_codon:yes gene_type:complete
MEIKLYARNIDNKLRTALYAMTSFAMAELVPSKRLRNNISINVHLKHHEEDGEAMLEEYANRYRPRDFKVIIDHHRAEIDDYGRTRTDTEWGHTILRILAHELVHVKQYLVGDMTCRTKGMLWKGVMFAPEYLTEQLKTPYEVEAYGKERGLLVSFFIKWKEIEEKMGMKYSLNKEK